MELKHGFYLKSKKEQIWIQVRIGFIALLILLLVFLICWGMGFFLPLILGIPIILSVVAPFFDVPALKKSGDLVYYSPLFLAEKAKKEKITIHGGTLFDYVFVIDRSLNGRERRNLIMEQYLEGLVHLIDHLQKDNPENLTIRGTSYILNKRTAKKIGFQVVQTDFLQKVILIYNYFNLVCANSLAKGKLTFPKLGEIQTFEARLYNLMERRDFINSLNLKLKQRQMV
ncbi:hypothetical protein SAMN04489724_0052 [Algoriphagus locisalis]|uniref:Uncharacterized protein n=1 Tax=Algoriphagus locisalis TaxID=305507 RepID=A0A1I7E4X7_9BACT|nr:hypothetical protein [Algoriphagus locisalis]SFU18873.1 hypothetical protein SAMN04489724_0052 [Algoriphagus locisalis]